MLLNAYKLKLPTLSLSLTADLLDLANSLDINTGHRPRDELSEQDLESLRIYQETTGTVACRYRSFQMPDTWQLAIKKELTDQLLPFSKMNIYFQVISDGDVLCPHTDIRRITNLMYNISADGATTHFHDRLIDDLDRHVFTESEISKPVETYVFEPYKWYIFNNQKIHSVTNITKKRIALAANIPYDFHKCYDHMVGKLF